MLFIDRVKIFVKAGDGGDGSVSFRREKYVPRGGPDGGDGGNGGDIILRATSQASTLLDYKYRHHYRIKRAGNGLGKKMKGKDSATQVLLVPLGTVVHDAESQNLLADITQEGQEKVLAKGGRGGRGNTHFATATNQTPLEAEEGTKGEEHWLLLELKLLADVGLVGFPNAGKSTLLSRISSAKPKIADYPFTTLTPLLGSVRWGEEKSFVVADIPGLIQGAHTGKGLGIQFLRHIERTRILAFLIDISEFAELDSVAQFRLLREEMGGYHAMLLEKPFVVVATKLDIKGDEERLARLESFCREEGLPFFSISAVVGEGVETLLHYLGERVDAARSVGSCPNDSAMTA